MYFDKWGKAKTRQTHNEVFGMLIKVYNHAKSPTTYRLPSVHRAALWNLWIALENGGPANLLRDTVAQAVLDVADAVLEAAYKHNRDSITVWIVAQLILHLARYSITYHDHRQRPRMAESKRWEPLMFMADAELRAMDKATPFSQRRWIEALIAEHPALGFSCKCLLGAEKQTQRTLAVLRFENEDELAFLEIADDKWSISFTRVRDCFRFRYRWDMCLVIEKLDVHSPHRVLRFDRTQWSERVKKDVCSIESLVILERSDERVLAVIPELYLH